eukprot:849565_1
MEWAEIKLAKLATLKKGQFDTFNGMKITLERVQKSLDQYLEKKRQLFPRFYFLSDDDLLEVLGNARDPDKIQKNIKKCFVGIHTLDLVPPGQNGNKTWEASGMSSPDGENVPFNQNILCTGPVEVWLGSVQTCMRDTLKRLLQGALQHVQRASRKREAWIKTT